MTQPLVEQFAIQLRRRQVQGSTDTAEQTLDILYSVIRNHECTDGLSLITTIRQVAQQLVQAQPCEFSVANMIRRILYAIRQEFRNESNASGSGRVSRKRADSITLVSSLDSLCLANPTSSTGNNDSSIIAATSGGNTEENSSSTIEVTFLEGIAASGASIDIHSMQNNNLDDTETTLQEINGLVRRNLGVGALYGASSASGASGTAESFIFNLIAAERPPTLQPDYTRNVVTLKEQVMEVLRELLAELDSCHPSINEQAFDIVHEGEIILTIGRAKSVELFLKTLHQGDSIRRPRKFKLIVAEGSPEYRGHEMVKIMSEYGVDTTLISDSAIFSFASRANKAIIGCHAVTTSGSLITSAGNMMLVSAASYHKIPVVALAGLHKFTPCYPEKSESNNLDSAIVAPWMDQLVNPNYIYPYWDGDMLLSGIQPINLHFDVVPSKHVSIIITNIGAMDPHSVHKVITDMYSKEDYVL